MKGFVYQFTPPGLEGELSVLSAREVVEHLRNYLGNFLLDPVVCSVYLNRLLKEPWGDMDERVNKWTRYLIGRMLEMKPFDVRLAQKAHQMGIQVPNLSLLQRCSLPARIMDAVALAARSKSLSDLRSILLGLIYQFPHSPQPIEMLLNLETDIGVFSDPNWVNMTRFNSQLQPYLNKLLFIHAMNKRDYDSAEKYADRIDLSIGGQDLFNYLAEFRVLQNRKDEAVRLYEVSYEMDPSQIPIKYRLNALSSGSPCWPDALYQSIAICIYSYNKADLLARTLVSLGKSRIGRAKIFCLLNGCTDSSLDRVKLIDRQVFGHNPIKIISLPVNIGAPAARNWLLSLEEVRSADFVAFLDDDVEVKENWLEGLVSTLHDHGGGGVAGVKVLNPGQPERIQYLYRNIAVARNDLIRISLDTPNWNYDVGFYDVVRPTVNVMGCCHVFRRKALDTIPFFDIRYSPSQMDDIAHDIHLVLSGHQVIYNGNIHCVHYQGSGVGRGSRNISLDKLGNVIGNDVKFFYHFATQLKNLLELNNHREVPKYPSGKWTMQNIR